MVKDLLKPVKIPSVRATAKAGVIERLKAFTTSKNLIIKMQKLTDYVFVVASK